MVHFDSMNTLVKQEPSMTLLMQSLTLSQFPESDEVSKDFGIGELHVDNFEQNELSVSSEPIFVDGRAWKLIFDRVPKPADPAQRSTHISLHL